MATAAAVDIIRRVEVLNDGRVAARLPLGIGVGMASAAHGRRQLDARLGNDIVRVRGMITGHPVAVLTLKTRKLRGRRRTGESSGYAVAHTVTRKTGWIILLVVPLEHGERASMWRFAHRVIDRLVALNAVLPTHVMRGRAG